MNYSRELGPSEMLLIVDW